MSLSLQLVNLGNYANDGTGDDLRTAFQKVNNNFTSLNTLVNISNGENLGEGARFFKDRNVDTLEFRTLTSIDNTITITETESTVDVSMATMLEMDPNPTLGGDLNLNGHYIYGGDVQTSVHNLEVPFVYGLLELLFQSNSLNVDMGSVLLPTGLRIVNGHDDTGIILDFGGIIDSGHGGLYPNNSLDFGSIIN